MRAVSFKERVRNEAIANAKLYKANYVDYEYRHQIIWIIFSTNNPTKAPSAYPGNPSGISRILS